MSEFVIRTSLRLELCEDSSVVRKSLALSLWLEMALTDYSQYSESQKEWLKNYLCGAVKVSYVEIDTFDEAGSTNIGKF